MRLHKPPGTLPRKRVSALTFRDFVPGLELLTGSDFMLHHQSVTFAFHVW